MFLPPGKQFVVHIECMNLEENDPNIYRISISNIFHKIKKSNNVLQLPSKLNGIWTMLQLNLFMILTDKFNINRHIIKSIQLCSNA
jgi:hypothetical protein